MTEHAQTKAPPWRRLAFDARPADIRWMEIWAVVASVAFIVLIVAGVFPRVPW